MPYCPKGTHGKYPNCVKNKNPPKKSTVKAVNAAGRYVTVRADKELKNTKGRWATVAAKKPVGQSARMSQEFKVEQQRERGTSAAFALKALGPLTGGHGYMWSNSRNRPLPTMR